MDTLWKNLDKFREKKIEEFRKHQSLDKFRQI
jgi:hypothetical protein